MHDISYSVHWKFFKETFFQPLRPSRTGHYLEIARYDHNLTVHQRIKYSLSNQQLLITDLAQGAYKGNKIPCATPNTHT